MRGARIDADVTEANKLKSAAEHSMAAYQKALAEARARAQTIGAETRDRLSAEADKNRKALEEQLNVKLAEAERTIAATRTQAMTNVHAIAADAAAAIVARLTGASPAAGAVASAVDTVLKR